MSVHEAARYLGVTEKTIYRYLDKQRLPSEKIGLVHFIPRAAVEALAVSGHVQTEDRDQARRIETLFELIGAQDFRIKELERQLKALQATIAATSPLFGHVQTPPDTPEPQQASTDQDQPADTIPLKELAQRLGVNRNTLRDYILKHDLPHVQVINPLRPHETKRYFTSEQQETILQHRSRGVETET